MLAMRATFFVFTVFVTLVSVTSAATYSLECKKTSCEASGDVCHRLASAGQSMQDDFTSIWACNYKKSASMDPDLDERDSGYHNINVEGHRALHSAEVGHNGHVLTTHSLIYDYSLHVTFPIVFRFGIKARLQP